MGIGQGVESSNGLRLWCRGERNRKAVTLPQPTMESGERCKLGFEAEPHP